MFFRLLNRLPHEPPVVGRRDRRVDLLRGLAVFIMIVDHIGLVSPLSTLTGHNLFFVSAAEGFVFIAGFLVGVIYGDQLRRNGWSTASRKALVRALKLAGLSIGLALGFAAFSFILALPWAASVTDVSTEQFILEVVTYRRTFYLVDVLQLYAFLLALTPGVLWLLGRRAWSVVLIGSLALWISYQDPGTRLELPWPVEQNTVFHFTSWQVLFVGALLLGYHRDELHRVTDRLRALPWRGGWLPLLTGAFVLLIWLHATEGAALAAAGLVSDPAVALGHWFDKATLPPLRLVACAVVFAFAWTVVSRGWRVVRFLAGWLLLPLGTAPLDAYALHIFITGVLRPHAPDLAAQILRPLASIGVADPSSLLPWANLVVQLGTLGLIWTIVQAAPPTRLLKALASPARPPSAPRGWERPVAR